MDSWAEYMNILGGKVPAIPSIGPMQTSRKQMVAVSKELADATQALATYNNYLAQYYAKVGATWMEAAKKAIAGCQQTDVGQDSEKIQRMWIDTLEEEFTELFSREDFAVVSGELLNSESEVNKHLSNIAEIYSRNLRIPTRSEINDIYDEIAKMKRFLKRLSDKAGGVERIEGESESGSATTRGIQS